MIQIYFTRHGQTDWNVQKRIQGQVDIPLNETGLKQAQQAALALKDIPFDVVFSSPLSRAVDTAKILKGDRDVPLITDARLTEEYYGDLEGASRLNNPVYQKQRVSIFKRYPNGESYLDVYARISSFFHDLKEKYDGKVSSVLIVAHGGMSRVVNCYFMDMENEEFPSYSIDNCQIVTYQLK